MSIHLGNSRDFLPNPVAEISIYKYNGIRPLKKDLIPLLSILYKIKCA
jgi:hypothetical protein